MLGFPHFTFSSSTTTGTVVFKFNGRRGICDDDGDDYFPRHECPDRRKACLAVLECVWEMENYNYRHRDRNDNNFQAPSSKETLSPNKFEAAEPMQDVVAFYEITLCYSGGYGVIVALFTILAVVVVCGIS